MIITVKNLYCTQNLNGDALVHPSRSFQRFFAKKIEDSTGLAKVSWLIAHIATGTFAYPILGGLAGLGMLIKAVDAFSFKKKSATLEYTLNSIKTKNTFGNSLNETSYYEGLGWQMKTVREFNLTKQNIDELTPTVNQEFKTLSNQFQKIYISTSGFIDNQGLDDQGFFGVRGSINLKMKILERV